MSETAAHSSVTFVFAASCKLKMSYSLRLVLSYHAVWLSFQLYRLIGRTTVVELEVTAYVSGQLLYNGIIQRTNCKLDWVYQDPVAWNARVDPSF